MSKNGRSLRIEETSNRSFDDSNIAVGNYNITQNQEFSKNEKAKEDDMTTKLLLKRLKTNMTCKNRSKM
jgi:hypothetical protein